MKARRGRGEGASGLLENVEEMNKSEMIEAMGGGQQEQQDGSSASCPMPSCHSCWRGRLVPLPDPRDQAEYGLTDTRR